MSQDYVLTLGNNFNTPCTTKTNILIMRYNELGKIILVVGALLLSISVFGQGRGDGKGNGRGGSERHKGSTAQKTKYKNVASIQVFSSTGVELYNSSKKPAKSKEPLPVIQRVETDQYGVRIFFVTSDPVQRVIDMKCEHCVILIDYKKAYESTSD